MVQPRHCIMTRAYNDIWNVVSCPGHHTEHCTGLHGPPSWLRYRMDFKICTCKTSCHLHPTQPLAQPTQPACRPMYQHAIKQTVTACCHPAKWFVIYGVSEVGDRKPRP